MRHNNNVQGIGSFSFFLFVCGCIVENFVFIF
jgi:hypothetical protein